MQEAFLAKIGASARPFSESVVLLLTQNTAQRKKRGGLFF